MGELEQQLDPSSGGQKRVLEPSSELEEALEEWFRKRYGTRIPKPWGDLPPDCGNRILRCGPGLFPPCVPELFQELTIELPKCGPEFYERCDFDRLIQICPFDPAWEAFDWKQQVVSERLQALEVQVKELQAKLPTHK